MNNSSTPIFDRYAELDFTEAKPVADVPALAKLQAQHGGKSCINMRGDDATQADVVREVTRKERPAPDTEVCPLKI